MTRLGWLRQDEILVHEGRLVYGRALVGLQKALYDKNSLCQAETMATSHVLALYEVGNIPMDV